MADLLVDNNSSQCLQLACILPRANRYQQSISSKNREWVMRGMKAPFVPFHSRDLGVRGASIVLMCLSCLINLKSDFNHLCGSLHGLNTFWARGLSWIHKERERHAFPDSHSLFLWRLWFVLLSALSTDCPICHSPHCRESNNKVCQPYRDPTKEREQVCTSGKFFLLFSKSNFPEGFVTIEKYFRFRNNDS